MIAHTQRFGTLTIRDSRVIIFSKGLLGFQDKTRYALLDSGDNACFFWLQSLDDAALAFVVTDPSMFVRDYSVPLCQDQASGLAIQSLEDVQVLVIVNKVNGALTMNLAGPLVINTRTLAGEQVIVTDKRWKKRHTLFPGPKENT